MKTQANKSCDRPEIPATDLVFHIFVARINIATKWAKSAVRRKIFMVHYKNVDLNRLKHFNHDKKLSIFKQIKESAIYHSNK